MENNRDGFFLYKSFYDAIQFVPNEKSKLRLYQALAEYAILDKEPDISGWEMALFITWKTNVDKSVARREAAIFNGEKGGRPKKVESKPNNNPVEPNIKPNTKVNNLNKKLDNKKKPNTNLNNNINANSEFEVDVEDGKNTIDYSSEQVLLNYLSDAPDEGGIGDNMIDKLDQQFQFNNRYNIIINENPSIDFDEIIETLLIDFNGIFDTVNVKKMKLQPFTSYKTYQKLVRNKTEPKVIFYEIVKSLQYILSDDDPRMSLYINKH